MGVAAYLWSRGGSGVAGCDALGGADCDAALSSRWAKVAGVPVSLLGGGCYAAMLAGVAMIACGVTAGWRVVELLIPAALGAAAWFVGLQLTGASPLCPYCLTIHAMGVLACSALLVERFSTGRKTGQPAGLAALTVGSPQQPSPSTPEPAPPIGAPTFLGLLGMISVVVTQVVMPPEVAVIDASEFSLASNTGNVPQGDNPVSIDAGPVDASPVDAGLVAKAPQPTPQQDNALDDRVLDDNAAEETAAEETAQAKVAPDERQEDDRDDFEEAPPTIAATPASPAKQTSPPGPPTPAAPPSPAGETIAAATSISATPPKTASPPSVATTPKVVSPPDAAAETAPSGPRPEPGLARRTKGSREIKLLKGQLTLDTYENPMLGSPAAPHIVVEMMSYSCPHCREFAEMLEEARPRYGDQLAVLVIPIPTELLCNKYVSKVHKGTRGACRLTRVALAFAEASPAGFERYHHWLLDTKRLRNWNSALVKAKDLTGSDRVEEAFVSPENKKRLENYIELYGTLVRAGATVLPTQVLGNVIAPGKPATVDRLCEMWEEHLGVRPIGSN